MSCLFFLSSLVELTAALLAEVWNTAFKVGGTA
jgi:hypothetical protein